MTKRDFESLRRFWADWPELDQAAWEKAITPAVSVLTMTKPMQALRDISVRQYARNMSKAILWVLSNCDAGAERIADLWTAERLKAYLDSMKGYSAATVRIRLISIDRVIAAITPDAPRGHIAKQLRKFPRKPGEVSPRLRGLEAQALYDCGVVLCHAALELPDSHRYKWLRLRTGLQIALLALRPLRLTAFTGIEILDGPPLAPSSPYLWRAGTVWILGFPETSNPTKRNPSNLPVPGSLVELLQDYIRYGRPRLCRGRPLSEKLWISSRSELLTPNAVYKQICAGTQSVLGFAVNPHLFRDCYATSASNDLRPNHSVELVLGHSKEVFKAHYDHSTTFKASGDISAFTQELLGGGILEGLRQMLSDDATSKCEEVELSLNHNDRGRVW